MIYIYTLFSDTPSSISLKTKHFQCKVHVLVVLGFYLIIFQDGLPLPGLRNPKIPVSAVPVVSGYIYNHSVQIVIEIIFQLIGFKFPWLQRYNHLIVHLSPPGNPHNARACLTAQGTVPGGVQDLQRWSHRPLVFDPCDLVFRQLSCFTKDIIIIWILYFSIAVEIRTDMNIC